MKWETTITMRAREGGRKRNYRRNEVGIFDDLTVCPQYIFRMSSEYAKYICRKERYKKTNKVWQCLGSDSFQPVP